MLLRRLAVIGAEIVLQGKFWGMRATTYTDSAQAIQLAPLSSTSEYWRWWPSGERNGDAIRESGRASEGRALDGGPRKDGSTSAVPTGALLCSCSIFETYNFKICIYSVQSHLLSALDWCDQIG